MCSSCFKKPGCVYACLSSLLLSVVLLVVLAIGGKGWLHDLLGSQVNSQVLIESSAQRFDIWKTQTPGVLGGRMLHAYMYDLQNPHEVLKGGKPRVRELGPFVYSYGWERFNLTYSENKDTLEYREWKYWKYEPKWSAPGYPDDTKVFVTSVNLAFQGIFGGLSRLQYPSGIDMVYPQSTTDFERLFANLSVNEWMMGYNDTHLTQMQQEGLGSAVPGAMPGFMGRNLTWSEASSTSAMRWNRVGTGIKNKANAYKLTQRWGMENISVCMNTNIPVAPCPGQSPQQSAVQPWATQEAALVDGSDGMNFPHGLKEDAELSLWVDPLIRNLKLRKTGETTAKNIKLWRFSSDPSAWGDMQNFPAAAAYYQNYSTGLMNLSSVQHGAAVFVSKPHFLDCNESFRLAVDGISPPNREEHDFAFDVEPWTGLTMGGAGRVQVNTQVQPLRFLNSSSLEHTLFPEVKPVLIPLAWIADGGSVSDKQATQWHNTVGLLLTVADYTLLSCLLLAAVLVICAVLVIVRFRKSKVDEQARDLNDPLQRHTNV